MRQLTSWNDRAIGAGAFALLALLTCVDASAACAVNPGGYGPTTGNAYDPYAPAASQFSIAPTSSILAAPSNPVAGQILMRMTRPLPTLTGSAQGRATAYYGCVQGTAEVFSGIGSLVSGFTNVYSTGIAGIGYRVAYYMTAGDPSSAVFAPQIYTNPYANGVMFYPFSGSSVGPTNLETMIELVATGGPVGLGTITAAQVSAGSAVAGAPSTQLYRVYLASNITVANPTCNTTSSALSLMLPDVSTTTLLQDGVGPKTDLMFSVSCSVPSSLSPSITVNSPNLVANTTSTLSNISTDANKAEGVGIELWLGSGAAGGGYFAPTFGTAYPNYGSSSDGDLPATLWNFRIAANLKKLGANNAVRAGPVMSTATLTFTYN
jgi:hypothetical protein